MSQIYTGEVKNGVVVFDPGATLPPEGTRVHVEPVGLEKDVEDLSRRLLSIAGT